MIITKVVHVLPTTYRGSSLPQLPERPQANCFHFSKSSPPAKLPQAAPQFGRLRAALGSTPQALPCQNLGLGSGQCCPITGQCLPSAPRQQGQSPGPLTECSFGVRRQSHRRQQRPRRPAGNRFESALRVGKPRGEGRFHQPIVAARDSLPPQAAPNPTRKTARMMQKA